ncbi:MAG: hypothetical protein ACO1OO_07205 [Flavisolibacter sp.]
MIAKKALRELVDQKLKDADVLIANRRYATAIYIVGYALELALKLKICKIFKFAQGFPENKAEFIVYQNNVKSQPLLAGTITRIKDIRIHDLNKLLFYSGVEYRIKLNYLNEWNLVVGWDPEMRYKAIKILKREAVTKVTAIETLIQNIL